MVFGLRVARGKILVIVETIVGLGEPLFSTVRWRDVLVFLYQILPYKSRSTFDSVNDVIKI
jgi:hypothetical protein